MNVLITGSNGQVGTEIIKLFSTTHYNLIPCTRKELDCTQITDVFSKLSSLQPDLIINTAAYTAVDKAEDEVSLAHQVNAEFVEQLALYCTANHTPLIHLSTDYVFDGNKNGSYCETDLANPQGVYAQSKYAGEQAITSHLKEHIILRVSWVFGAHGNNFVKTILNLASSREELRIVSDQWGRPTAARDIARVLLEIVQKISQSSFNDWGIYHYAGTEVTNWYEFSNVFIELAKKRGIPLAINRLSPIKSEDYITKAVRPKNSVLDTTKIESLLGIQCHHWEDYLPEVIDFVNQ